MRRAFGRIVFLILILAVLAGLWMLKGRISPGGDAAPQGDTAGGSQMQEEQQTDLQTEPQESAEGQASGDEEAAPDASGSQTESFTQEAEEGEERKLIITEEQTGYAYGLLNEEQQLLYREMYGAVVSFQEEAELSTLDVDQLRPAFYGMMADHPEIFYVEGYTYTTHTVGDELSRITFSAHFTLDQAGAEQRQEQIDACVDRVMAGMDGNTDDYGKIKYFYEYIIENTDYNLDAPENQNICSVFLNGESVCQGYAKAFQYLCGQAGIPAVLVTGTVKRGESHAWTLVRADGEWYYVDPTWGDAYYRIGESDPAWQTERRPRVNYDYLCVTTEQLLVTHKPDQSMALPECTSMADNYYVRENAYFDEVDLEKVAALFEQAYASGRENITMKCSSQAVYDALCASLLEQQKIFDYLQNGSSSVSYVDSPEQLTLTFWLV